MIPVSVANSRIQSNFFLTECAMNYHRIPHHYNKSA